MPITVNGAKVSSLAEAWDLELSNDDANIVLGKGTSLKVYNMGVYVRDYSSHNFGVTGVIVSKKALKVNFARNDVMSDCPVWRRIKKAIDNTDKLQVLLNKRRLNDHERLFVVDKYLAGELKSEDLRYVKLFADVAGTLHSWGDICNGRFPAWSMAKKGDRAADMLMQMRKAIMLDEEELRLFMTLCPDDKLENLFKNFCRDALEYIPFSKLIQGVDLKNVLIPEQDWKPSELVWLDIIHDMEWRIRCRRDVDLSWWSAEYLRRENQVGMSSAALAWTDGKGFIAFDRKYLARNPILDNKGRINVTSVTEIALSLVHEMAHDGDSITQVHSNEFFNLYHDLSMGVPKAVGTIVSWYNKERIADRMKRLTKKKGKVVQLKTAKLAAAKTKRFKKAYRPKKKAKTVKVRTPQDLEIPE